MNTLRARLRRLITQTIPPCRLSRKCTKLLAIGLLWLSCGCLTLQAIAADDPEYMPDQLIVVYQPGVQESEKDAVQNAHGDQRLKSLASANGRVLKVSPRRSLRQAVEEYQAEVSVLHVQPNYIYHAVEKLPNDGYFYLQYGLKNIGQAVNGTVGTAGADIEATLAWDKTTGSKSVVVGVIDTGILYTHSDLAPNIWTAPDGSHGYNAITGTKDPLDDNGHGTHVAGTIGAAGNNGAGVVGVNWSVSLMALKFLDSSGSGTTGDAIEAIDFAVNAKRSGVNIRVLNASWGGGSADPLLLGKIQEANAENILFVAAAGNGDYLGRPVNIDTSPFYPASYSLSAANVIAVAATDNRDGIASFSNYGAQTVQLGAPGVSILSTYTGNNYAYMSGTSMATPHVAGCAALVLSTQPDLTAEELKTAILKNVDPITSLSGKTITGGRLNANKAVTAGPPVPAPSETPTLSATAGAGQVSLSWNSVSTATSYNVKRSTTSGGPYGTIASVTTTRYVDNNVTAGTYYYVVSALNSGGEGPPSSERSATPTDFTIAAGPSPQAVQRGQSINYTVTIGSLNGFSAPVQLSVSGLPAKATASFNPSSVSGAGTSIMTVTTSTKTTTGTKNPTITGTSGLLKHTTIVQLSVTR